MRSRNCSQRDIYVFGYTGVDNQFSDEMERTTNHSEEWYLILANPIARQYMFSSRQIMNYLNSDPLPPICLQWLARQIVVEVDGDLRRAYLDYYMAYMGASAVENLLVAAGVDQRLLRPDEGPLELANNEFDIVQEIELPSVAAIGDILGRAAEIAAASDSDLQICLRVLRYLLLASCDYNLFRAGTNLVSEPLGKILGKFAQNDWNSYILLIEDTIQMAFGEGDSRLRSRFLHYVGHAVSDSDAGGHIHSLKHRLAILFYLESSFAYKPDPDEMLSSVLLPAMERDMFLIGEAIEDIEIEGVLHRMEFLSVALTHSLPRLEAVRGKESTEIKVRQRIIEILSVAISTWQSSERLYAAVEIIMACRAVLQGSYLIDRNVF
jgi:hypothetical protein